VYVNVWSRLRGLERAGERVLHFLEELLRNDRLVLALEAPPAPGEPAAGACRVEEFLDGWCSLSVGNYAYRRFRVRVSDRCHRWVPALARSLVHAALHFFAEVLRTLMPWRNFALEWLVLMTLASFTKWISAPSSSSVR
jgi:hypothetical protein